MMTELEIPEASFQALFLICPDWDESTPAAVGSARLIAAPVLAAFLRGKAAEVEAELVPAAAALGRATAGGTGYVSAQNQVVALAFLRDRLDTWIAELGGGEPR